MDIYASLLMCRKHVSSPEVGENFRHILKIWSFCQVLETVFLASFPDPTQLSVTWVRAWEWLLYFIPTLQPLALDFRFLASPNAGVLTCALPTPFLSIRFPCHSIMLEISLIPRPV